MDRVAILLSGRGSNAEAILRRAASETWPATFLLVSNVPDAPGLRLGAEFGWPTEVLDHRPFPIRSDFDRALAGCLLRWEVRLVVLAGFMRVLGPTFLSAFAGRVLNIHPSLLPRHRGLSTHRRVIEAGDKEHGCTVHLVEPELDGGPILAQTRVAVGAGDDEQTLAARVLQAEHQIYPAVVRSAILGKLDVEYPPRPQVAAP